MFGFIDLLWTVTIPVRSLPVFHGARWNALLRLAARVAGVSAEDAYLGLIPQRQGRRPMLPGETVRLRLHLHLPRLAAARALVRALRDQRIGEGEFRSGGTLTLTGLELPLPPRAGDPAELLDDFIQGALPVPACLPEHFGAEFAAFQAHSGPWHLECLTPLRLTRPAGDKGDFPFAGKEFFQGGPQGPACLFSRLRPCWAEPAAQIAAGTVRITDARLSWTDLAYNPDRRIRLGGLTGRICLEGRPPPATARLLVGGQYAGAGKNARFGFGLYRVPELDAVRQLRHYPEMNVGT